MSESTARSQVRYSEKTDNDPAAPLISVSDIKLFFNIQDTTLDAQLTLATEIVSAVIRSYTGRNLTYGQYTEVFTDVFEPKVERYLVETPVVNYAPTNIGALLNKNTGRVVLTGGPSHTVMYQGGYQTLPADLSAVCMELVRQQMAAWGVEELGSTRPANVPQEKAVWLGTLKVEYAVNATSAQAKASGAGGFSEAALAPYLPVLEKYRSHRALVAT
jgi:hypothetical protein